MNTSSIANTIKMSNEKIENKMFQIERIIPNQSIKGKDEHVSISDGLKIDVYRLIHLTEEVNITEVLIVELLHALQEKCWTDKNGKGISPNEIVQKYKEENGNMENLLKKYPELGEHFDQISRADLAHPILVSQGEVIDGVHRLVKAVIQGEPKIKAKIINSIPEGAIIKQ